MFRILNFATRSPRLNNNGNRRFVSVVISYNASTSDSHLGQLYIRVCEKKTTKIQNRSMASYLNDLGRIDSADTMRNFSFTQKPLRMNRDQQHTSTLTEQGTFVSKFYELQDGEIEYLLQRHNLNYRKSSNGFILELCPFCHAIKGRLDNMFKLNINGSNGVYHCFRCGAKGNWWSFREKLSAGFGATSAVRAANVLNVPIDPKTIPKLSPEDIINYAFQLYQKENAHVLSYLLDERGLSLTVIQKYGVGTKKKNFMDANGNWISQDCIIFPMYDDEHNAIKIKCRSISCKSHMSLEPKGSSWGLFGLNTVPKDASELIITEGEFDAMAAYQGTGIPAVSLPNGAQSLPIEVLPMLERFEKLYLWFDDDVAGHHAIQNFSKKLGLRRCRVLKARKGENEITVKDANDALRQRLDFEDILNRASVVNHADILHYRDLREQLFLDISNQTKLDGTASKWFLDFSEITKGLRRGELTIFSGSTGVGKTTFLSQLSLDYCCQGISTLFGSFEVSNVRLAKVLLHQYYGKMTGRGGEDLKMGSRFTEISDRFEHLGYYFLNYFGSVSVDKVIDAMEHAAYVYDVSHFVLDNLQFMTSGQGRGYEKFEVMDSAIEKLRRFSTTTNTHVTLVVHPRKENDGQLLQTASIFGTAKATQEADNVIFLQRDGDIPFLDVRKNRYDGQLGKVPLSFDRDSKVFVEIREGSPGSIKDEAFLQSKVEDISLQKVSIKRVHLSRGETARVNFSQSTPTTDKEEILARHTKFSEECVEPLSGLPWTRKPNNKRNNKNNSKNQSGAQWQDPNKNVISSSIAKLEKLSCKGSLPRVGTVVKRLKSDDPHLQLNHLKPFIQTEPSIQASTGSVKADETSRKKQWFEIFVYDDFAD